MLEHCHIVTVDWAFIQTGESQGGPRFKISWNKVSKRFGVEPVLEQKSYKYLEDMLQAALHLDTPQVKNHNDL